MAHKAKARTRIKYKGERYAPGDTVTFDSKEDAAAYGSAIEGGEDATPDAGGGGDDLDSIVFASPAARTAAEEAELTAADFKRKKKSSENGFTVEDVERIAAQ